MRSPVFDRIRARLAAGATPQQLIAEGYAQSSVYAARGVQHQGRAPRGWLRIGENAYERGDGRWLMVRRWMVRRGTPTNRQGWGDVVALLNSPVDALRYIQGVEDKENADLPEHRNV